MNDWQVGDLALCLESHKCTDQWEPSVGGIYTVSEVGCNSGGTLWIDLKENPLREDEWAFDPRKFRKIRPDEHEACEPEFVTLLKRAKRKVSA